MKAAARPSQAWRLLRHSRHCCSCMPWCLNRAALAGLGWLWYDAGWNPARAVKLGTGTLGGLLLAFIVFLPSLLMASGLSILIAAITLVVSSAAAVIRRANWGYLPRVWYISLGSS